jgi:hypothetical protein
MLITTDKIFFISGCGHSGTTVLAAILDAHPKLYTIKRETTWFSNFGNNSELIKKEYEFEKNKEETLFLKKEFLVEKTANHVFQVPLINRYFTNAQHIFVVRNPFDVCASLYQRYNDLDRAINRWIDSNHFVVQHSIHQWAYLVRYEQLVSNQQQQLEKLCKFMNIEYTSELLNFYKRDIQFEAHDAIYQKRNLQIKQPLSDYNNNFSSILDNTQINYIKDRTEKTRTILGYV